MYGLCFSMWLCQHQSSALYCLSLSSDYLPPWLVLLLHPIIQVSLIFLVVPPTPFFFGSPHKSYPSLFFSDHAAPLWRRKSNSLMSWNYQRIFFICHSSFTLKNTVLVNLHSLCDNEDHDPGSLLQFCLHPSVCCFLPSLSSTVTFLLKLLSVQLMYLSSALLSSCWLQLVNAWLIS